MFGINRGWVKIEAVVKTPLGHQSARGTDWHVTPVPISSSDITNGEKFFPGIRTRDFSRIWLANWRIARATTERATRRRIRNLRNLNLNYCKIHYITRKTMLNVFSFLPQTPTYLIPPRRTWFWPLFHVSLSIWGFRVSTSSLVGKWRLEQFLL